MGIEALIVAIYLPNMATTFLAALLYFQWRRQIRSTSDVNDPTKNLLTGIFFTFLGQTASMAWVALARMFELDYLERFFPAKEVSLSMFHFVPVILLINLIIFVGATAHLHAYWNARYGRSFVRIWVSLAVVWYSIIALVLY